MTRHPIVASSLFGLCLLALVGCDVHGGEPGPEPEPEPALPGTVDTMLGEPRFEAYRELLGAAGLEDLRARDEVTIFAPDNGAIDALPGACLTIWINDGRMADALAHQVVLGQARLDRDGLVVTASSGDPTIPMQSLEVVTIDGGPGDLRVDGQLIGAQLEAANGVVHPYSGQLLLPESLRRSLAAGCRD